MLQKRTGVVIGLPKVAAYREGFISDAELEAIGARLRKSGYGEYLLRALGDG